MNTKKSKSKKKISNIYEPMDEEERDLEEMIASGSFQSVPNLKQEKKR